MKGAQYESRQDYIDGSLVVNAERNAKEGLEEVKRFRRKYNTEHLKVHTMKIFQDGTQKIHTAAMVTPYVDVGTTGATAFSAEGICELLKNLNDADLDRFSKLGVIANFNALIDSADRK